jgi:hypothetical protein
MLTLNHSSAERAAHYQAQRDASLERMIAAKNARDSKKTERRKKTERLTPKKSPGGKKRTRKNRRKSRRNK